MRTIKLTGNFRWGKELMALFSDMEAADIELNRVTESNGIGSPEYHEALKEFNERKAAWEAHRDSPRSGNVHVK